jgi:hypothetical protein
MFHALLCSLNYDSDPNILLRLEAAVTTVQSIITTYEGSVARLLADDKGTRFKIAFGMPSMTHEDDAVRVVVAGLEIQSKLRELQVVTAIGIATGRCCKRPNHSSCNGCKQHVRFMTLPRMCVDVRYRVLWRSRLFEAL